MRLLAPRVGYNICDQLVTVLACLNHVCDWVRGLKRQVQITRIVNNQTVSCCVDDRFGEVLVQEARGLHRV